MGGANRVSGGDDVIHEIEEQSFHRPGGADKMVFMWLQPGQSPAAAFRRGFDRVDAGDGGFDTGSGHQRKVVGVILPNAGANAAEADFMRGFVGGFAGTDRGRFFDGVFMVFFLRGTCWEHGTEGWGFPPA